MNSEEIQSYLTNIEEFVFDEKKIVTFSWLSKTLGIHTNLSKQLLHTFYETCQKKEDLSVTYLVIGLKKEHNTCQVSVVSDKDIETVEKSLDVITSKHIYSIQKCQELPDLNVLYTAQKDESVSSISKGISSISFNCKERDDALMAKLKQGALPAVLNPPTLQSKKNVTPATSKSKSPVKKTNIEECNKNKGDESKETVNNQDSKGSKVHPMFKNVPAAKKSKVEKEQGNKKKPGGIGAFFSKSTKPTSTEPAKVEATEAQKAEENLQAEVSKRLSPLKENKPSLINNSKSDKDKEINAANKKENSHEVKEKTEVKSKKSPVKSSRTTKKVDTKKKKKVVTKKPAKDEKKRKRLVMMSDSDSNNSEEEEEVEREPTPEPEPTQVPDDDDMVCGTPEPSNRKRKKKLVSRSFISADGYMETEKVYVSCSEGEEEEVPEKKFKGENSVQQETKNTVTSNEIKSTNKVSSKKETKRKAPSPQKTKQSSLTSFFKKK